ncbi:MAG: guanylate kinase [Deltaproteobacteria bacterium]|nr:guanylate kinase [Deltaproteobacteria bacterium]
MEKTGRLFIVSGPSGAGKSTLCRKAIKHFGNLFFSISYTTREPRPGEVDGRDYRFVHGGRFREMIKGGEFLEYATVHGNLYGTRKKDVSDALGRSYDILLDIDVQGAEKVRKKLHGGVYIFLLPPSMEDCLKRLDKRGDVSSKELKKRLKRAMEEIKKSRLYDYIIINDDINGAFERLKSVITAERLREVRMRGEIKRLFKI